MTDYAPSTPLLSMRGVVLDTETTGLDAQSARLVQVAALKVVGERLNLEDVFERLVHPGVAIPAASSEIHGITDADVADAPTPDQVLSDLARFIDGTVIIGHTIGFDLAILKREAQLAGVAWPPTRALDVRTLAGFAAPVLADYSLDRLCDWLDITIDGRHTARGDAVATARVFAALLPRLRERGIRTIAEAQAACRRREERAALEVGRLPQVEAAGDQWPDMRAMARLDSYPYTHRVEQVMSAPAVILSGGQSLREALDLLIERGVSSVFVDDPDGEIGIVTERDVLRLVHAHGPDAFEQRLSDVKSTPLQSVASDAFVYRAIGRMDRLGIRHLGVHGRPGEIVGAVTTRNLLRHRATTAMMVGDGIAAAADETAIGLAWAQLAPMARLMAEEEVDPLLTAAVISSEICVLTRRAAELGEARMREAGRGGAPVAYAVLVLGSAGRGESLLAADQDNAIVYRSGVPGGPEDQWFEELGGHIADILDRTGVPYCTGGVMARNAQWRRSLDDWKATIDQWVNAQRPEDLLNVDIFFDAVPVHGDRALGEEVRKYAFERGRSVPTFWRALGEQLRGWRPPVGLFGAVRTGADGRADLKIGGLLAIVTAARILAIKSGVLARGTPERLRGAAERGAASPGEADRLMDAQRTLVGIVLAQQIADAATGIPLSPRVDLARLKKSEKTALRLALGRAATAVDVVREGML